jgi:uncharacterized protein with HEPN domain
MNRGKLTGKWRSEPSNFYPWRQWKEIRAQLTHDIWRLEWYAQNMLHKLPEIQKQVEDYKQWVAKYEAENGPIPPAKD